METEMFAVEKFARTVTPLPNENLSLGSDSRVSWGDGNLYPNFLLELYKNVPLHQSIVNSKVDYLIGEGIVNKATGKPLDIQISLKDTPTKVVQKVTFDYVLFGMYAVGVQYNIWGDPILIYHIPVNHIRSNRAKTKFWVCEDWYRGSMAAMSYDAFKPGKNKTMRTQVYVYSAYTPTAANVYPAPRYESAIVSMVTERLINDFLKDNLEDGFSAAHIISFFKGLPSTEQGKQFTEKVKAAYSGTKGAKYIIDYNNPPTSSSPGAPIKVETVDSPDYTGKLEAANKKNETNILTAHQATSRALFGIEQAAGLNGNDLENAYAIFKNVYVKNNRNNIEDGLNILFRAIGWPEIELKDAGAVIPKMLSDATKEKVYTIDELREIDGKAPLADGSGAKVLQVPGINIGGVNPQASEAEKVLIEVLGIGGTQALQAVLSDATMSAEQKKNALIIIFGLSPENAAILAGVVTGTVDTVKLSEQQPQQTGRILTELDFESVAHLGQSRDGFSLLDELPGAAEDFRRLELAFDDMSDIDDFLVNNDTSEMTTAEIRGEIKKRLGIEITTSELKTKITRLTEAGVIGDRPEKKSLTRDVKVLYEYSVRPGYGAELIDTSRGFCVKLIKNNRYYTREDIQQMSAIFGYNVFKHCGGWYYNTKTQASEKQCRHYWKTVRVLKKENND